ncbi:MAG: PD-(D/E)XK nuclease family protein [Pseudomonadota bacterium]
MTDDWRAAVPTLAPRLADAAAAMTLVEAASEREEAVAIALALRETLATPGKRAILVTPDRQLARQVTLALGRWDILPDDSAGRPLAVTPPGIFLRRVAALAGGLRPVPLLALLKHPLAGGQGAVRRDHLLYTSRLEAALRAHPQPQISRADLVDLASGRLAGAAGRPRVGAPAAPNPDRLRWAMWLAEALAPLLSLDLGPSPAGPDPIAGSGAGLGRAGTEMAGWAQALRDTSEALAAGSAFAATNPALGVHPSGGSAPDSTPGRAPYSAHDSPAADLVERPLANTADGAADRAANPSDGRTEDAPPPTPTQALRLWLREDGRAADQLLDALAAAKGCGGPVTARDFARLLDEELAAQNVPPADPARPVERRVRILGNREARLETADLVILGGLAEGVWPALPGADPWLSRPMRAQLGLAAPERRIGLAAHDFQTALGAPEVMLTRPKRRDGAPVLPARWLVRLTKLMEGCGPPGEAALQGMRQRGAAYLAQARGLDRPQAAMPRARRPEPTPPLWARPRSLPVTRIEVLIRDPYALYAEYVLKLTPLDPPDRPPDARLRGTVLHRVLQRYIEGLPDPLPADAAARLTALAGEEIDRMIPWPAERRLWRGRIARAAAWFASGEVARRAEGAVAALEQKGALALDLPGGSFTLTARADRIDRLRDGRLALIDYKTGQPPTPAQISAYQRQLPLTALIAEAGGFPAIGAAEVARLVWLGVNGAGEGGKAHVMLAPSASGPGERFDTRVDAARLVELLSAYDRGETPYRARLMPAFLTYEGPYDHLSRLGEWEGDTAMPAAGASAAQGSERIGGAGTDLAQMDLAQMDVAQMDRDQTDRDQTDLARADPAKAAPAQTGATQSDAAHSGAAQTGAAQTGAGRSDAAQTDAGRPGSASNSTSAPTRAESRS